MIERLALLRQFPNAERWRGAWRTWRQFNPNNRILEGETENMNPGDSKKYIQACKSTPDVINVSYPQALEIAVGRNVLRPNSLRGWNFIDAMGAFGDLGAKAARLGAKSFVIDMDSIMRDAGKELHGSDTDIKDRLHFILGDVTNLREALPAKFRGGKNTIAVCLDSAHHLQSTAKLNELFKNLNNFAERATVMDFNRDHILSLLAFLRLLKVNENTFRLLGISLPAAHNGNEVIEASIGMPFRVRRRGPDMLRNGSKELRKLLKKDTTGRSIDPLISWVAQK